jgi:hypothetical protein
VGGGSLEKSGKCGMQIRVTARLLCVRAYGNEPAGQLQMDRLSV